jgi:hypothetical protein
LADRLAAAMITTMGQRFVYLKIDGERFKVLRDEWDNATTPTSPIHLIEDDSQESSRGNLWSPLTST